MATDTETGGAAADPPPTLTMAGSENALAEEEAEKERKARSLKTIISRMWMGLAVASFVFQIIAMVVQSTGIVIAAGVIAMLIAPLVVKRQKDLQDNDSLRKIQNELRGDVNRLQTENNELTKNINELESSVDRVKDAEAKLAGLVKEQETTVDDLVGLVKENGTILDEMQNYLKGQVMSDLFDVVLRSDRSGDFTISGAEVDVFLLRLKNVNGVEIDEDHMRKKIEESGGDVSCIFNILRDLEKGDTPEEERIFTIRPENKTAMKTDE